METLEQKVQRLLDIEEIKNLLATYAKGADLKNDPQIMGPMFASDAVWECPAFDMRFEGRDAIAKGVSDAAQTDILWTLHYMVSPMVEVNLDAASGTMSWYLWELANMRGNSGEVEPVWVGGTYDSDVVKVDGAWYFSHVTLDLKLVAPFDKGWGEGPLPEF